MKKTIVVGSDRAGYKLKEEMLAFLATQDINVEHVGVESDSDTTLYPYIAKRVCDKIIESNYEKFGLLICGTGTGMCISANKFKGIRAVVCHDIYTTERTRLSNNANIICMGQNVVGGELAKMFLGKWISLEFTDPVAAQRVAAITEVEAQNLK